LASGTFTQSFTRRLNRKSSARALSDGFAEIYPEDKYLIVKRLQAGGHVVGMTGDGVNDAPALKQAEVGIAVGNATDIAKKSSSVVLTLEGFGGIFEMVVIGRIGLPEDIILDPQQDH
jgi:H+-transporting ATPase